MHEWDIACRRHQWIFRSRIALTVRRRHLAATIVDNRRLVTFVGPGSEVIFERIRIWWQIANLSEDDREVDGDYQRDEVQASFDHAQEEGCIEDLVICDICTE